jgi:hypothetical protein
MEVFMFEGVFALILLGFALGLRHGIDWDHIAAITDITSSVVATEEVTGQVAATQVAATATLGNPAMSMNVVSTKRHEAQQGFFLATLYALGHASVVALLGLLAIWAGTILPEWIDPIMERVVGVTLVVLGVWIFYSLLRYGRSFRLQSRWMVLFALVGRGWNWLKQKITRQEHEHDHAQEIAQYGAKAAFGIGMIHGIGAETGSQALLLAGAAGATTPASGSLMLLSFVVGLVISNSMIAVFSLIGFISSSTKRNVYAVIGVIAGTFSLGIGMFFILGQGAQLPDLQEVLNFFFGSVS